MNNTYYGILITDEKYESGDVISGVQTPYVMNWYESPVSVLKHANFDVSGIIAAGKHIHIIAETSDLSAWEKSYYDEGIDGSDSVRVRIAMTNPVVLCRIAEA